MFDTCGWIPSVRWEDIVNIVEVYHQNGGGMFNLRRRETIHIGGEGLSLLWKDNQYCGGGISSTVEGYHQYQGADQYCGRMP